MSSDPYQPLETAHEHHRPSAAPLILAVLVGFLLGGLLLWWLAPHLGGLHGPALNPNAAERQPAAATPPDAEETEAINVFKGARESVVTVNTYVLVRRLSSRNVERQATGTGSGFFWDDDGRIVTNFHVVREAVANQGVGVRVVAGDRSTWDARIVGVAPDYDLAVIQAGAPKDKIKKIKVGTSAGLQVGQKAFAIGNPFALSLTMTAGIVSAVDREIESQTDRPITGAIQTDAPINPGNSGGPLLDKDGRLIGVNTSIATPSGGNVGIGFAIPVDTVNRIVTEIIKSGKVLQPDAGVTLVDQGRLRRAGFPNGVMVLRVDPGGPADKAGLRGVSTDPQTGDVTPGDLILAIDGQAVNANTDFARLIAQHKVGDTVTLTVERDDKKMQVPLTLRGV